jgi:hypothetical protein
VRVGLHDPERRVVILGARHREQFCRITQVLIEFCHRNDQRFERFALAPQFLGALAVAPDRRVFG